MGNQFEPNFKNKSQDKKKETSMDSDFQKPYEISGEVIELAFSSPQFQKTLQETVSMVLQHHREFGFLICKEEMEDKFHYSVPIGGSEDSSTNLGVATEEMEKILEEIGLERQDWFPLGSLHFHGYEKKIAKSKVLLPSKADILTGLDYRELYEIPQVEIIANALSKNRVDALVYRESVEFSLLEKPAMLEELKVTIDELFKENATQEEVIKVLNYYGFQAGIISFLNGELTKKSKKFIRSLGMVIKRDTGDLV